jgi:3-oxoacyl-[acyl-carrier protein] reductase
MSSEEVKVALVTGGSRGIGRACAARLAQDGFAVAYTYNRTPKKEAESLGDGLQAYPIRMDVSEPSEVQDAVSQIEKELGRIGVLVHCAGVVSDDLLLRMKPDQFDSVLKTNLYSAFYLAKAVLPGMIRSRQGRIVLVSSVAGFMGNPGQVNYAASKAGLLGFARSLAKEVGSRNITVNLVVPGFIDTDMVRALPQARLEAVKPLIPLNRLGLAEEVAALVAFLCSEEAAYITGAAIPIDGGLAMGL